MTDHLTYRDIKFKIANTDKKFDNGRELFKEYANSLNIDLSFQDFQKELKTIDKLYRKPKGSLIIAYKNNTAIGCVGIRECDKNTAELKRMFVKTEYRGQKIGIKLLELAIDMAKELNYEKLRLDTLPTMKQAQNIYRLFGFYVIESYYFNPIDGTVFLEKKLI